MKNLLALCLLAIAISAVNAQNVPPQAIAFQGVAIDPNGYPVPSMDEFGNPLRNEPIRVRFSIQDSDGNSSTVHYSEEHAIVTDQYGRFALEIGRGNSVNANQFEDINWGLGKKFLKVEVDLSGTGAEYVTSSIQEMLSVPFALYAASAGNNADADADPTNEIQSLSVNGNQLSITGANTVTLQDNDSQTLSVNGSTLSISNGNNVTLLDNDQQTLSLSGQNLSISNGNSVTIPANTDSQTLTLNGLNLAISNGNSVNLSDLDSTNELQTMYLDSNYVLHLNKSGGSVDLSGLKTSGNTANVGVKVKNIASGNYCIYPKGLLDLDSIGAVSVAYEDDTLMVFYKGEINVPNFSGKFYRIDKSTGALISILNITHSALASSPYSGSWFNLGYYRPGRYIIQLGSSTNIYSETGTLLYGTNSPSKVSGANVTYSMGDSLMFSWFKNQASITSTFTRTNIYNNGSNSVNVSLCSNCSSVYWKINASNDDLFLATTNGTQYNVWKKGSSAISGVPNTGAVVQLFGDAYGLTWNSQQQFDVQLLNSTYSSNTNIFSFTGNTNPGSFYAPTISKDSDSTIRILFETNTSQLIGYQSITIPDASKSFLVEVLYNVVTGEMTVADISLIDLARIYYVDQHTNRVAVKLWGPQTCINGAIIQSPELFMYFP